MEKRSNINCNANKERIPKKVECYDSNKECSRKTKKCCCKAGKDTRKCKRNQSNYTENSSKNCSD